MLKIALVILAALAFAAHGDNCSILVGTPLLASPNYFVKAIGNISLSAVVTSNYTVTAYHWLVWSNTSLVLNQTTTTQNFLIDTSLLTASTNMTLGYGTVNTVNVTVDVVNTTSAASAVYTIILADTPTGTISLDNSMNSGHPANAFTDTLTLIGANLQVPGSWFGVNSSYQFGYESYSPSGDLVVNPVPYNLSGSNVTFAAPYVYNASATTTATNSTSWVTFKVTVSYGTFAVFSATASYPIVIQGTADTYLQQQITTTAASGNLMNALLNIGELLSMTRSTRNLTLINSAAAIVVQTLTTYVNTSGAASLTSSQQAQIIDVLNVCAGFITAGNLTSTYAAQIINVMYNVVASAAFDYRNAQKVINALANLGSLNTNTSVSTILAKNVANNAPLGEKQTFTSGNNEMAVMRLAGSAVKGASFAGSKASIQFPSNFVLAGLSSSTVVGVTTVTYSTNPYSSQSSTSLLSSVTSIDLSLDGTDTSVSGLSTPLVVTITVTDGASAVCAFWNSTTSSWSSSGLTKTGFTSTTINCSTTHLTDFAATSAASAAAISIAVLLGMLTIVTAHASW